MVVERDAVVRRNDCPRARVDTTQPRHDRRNRRVGRAGRRFGRFASISLSYATVGCLRGVHILKPLLTRDTFI